MKKALNKSVDIKQSLCRIDFWRSSRNALTEIMDYQIQNGNSLN